MLLSIILKLVQIKNYYQNFWGSILEIELVSVVDPDTGPDPGGVCFEKIILQDLNLVTVPKLLISDLDLTRFEILLAKTA